MIKKAWINLPVKDPQKSIEFFNQLGFSEDPRYGDCLAIGDIIVMLFPEPTFKNSTLNEIADTKQGTEVLITIEAENKEEVDEMAEKAEKAGGTIFSKPKLHGLMYGVGFSDLDGHRWNVLYLG
jgi:predicted lactoylglutathione lyase